MTYITTEELRQRLADQVPGALGLVARGLDVSIPKLVHAVEAGRVTWLAVAVALCRATGEESIQDAELREATGR